jgi:hypothetical protein
MRYILFTAIYFLITSVQVIGANLPGASALSHRPRLASVGMRQGKFLIEQRWRNALNQIERRVVDAHIEKSLFPVYHISLASAGGLEKLNGIIFSKTPFPITLTTREEWPPVLGGCLGLLNNQNYAPALQAIKPLVYTEVKDIPVLQRVLIQNALWDVFDSLYLQGINPWLAGKKFHRRRWQMLLYWLAHDISYIAVPKKDLLGYCRKGIVRYRVLGSKLWRNTDELFSFQQPTIHEAALDFRRVVRIYLYSPKIDFAKLSKKQLLLFCQGKKILGTGSVAIEVEDAITVLPGGKGLYPTRIPIIARSYRVIYSDRKHLMLNFSIYRLRHGEISLRPQSLMRLPGKFGTWALLNLPTIPDGSAGFLAKYPIVCAQCHYPGRVKSFRPGGPLPQYCRIVDSGTGFVQLQAIRRKRESPEYQALQFYCNQSLPRMQ